MTKTHQSQKASLYRGTKATKVGKAVVSNTKPPPKKVGAPRRHGETICPVCELSVALRQDGSIGSHRVGTKVTGRWLCAGSGAITRSDVEGTK